MRGRDGAGSTTLNQLGWSERQWSRGRGGWEPPGRQPPGPGDALTQVPVTRLIVDPESKNRLHQLLRKANPGGGTVALRPCRLDARPAQYQKKVFEGKTILEESALKHQNRKCYSFGYKSFWNSV